MSLVMVSVSPVMISPVTTDRVTSNDVPCSVTRQTVSSRRVIYSSVSPTINKRWRSTQQMAPLKDALPSFTMNTEYRSTRQKFTRYVVMAYVGIFNYLIVYTLTVCDMLTK